MFEALSRTFPVSCASDEFYYFPQVQLPEMQWSTWDCFASETVTEITQHLFAWEHELELIDQSQSDLEVCIDINLLQKIARTIREQLSEVRSWEFQPTLYLTLACIGLAEAVESEDPAAKHERARSLGSFLDQASRTLKRVPVLFRDIGLDMISGTRHYLALLEKRLPELKPALAALDRFEEALKKVNTGEGFSSAPRPVGTCIWLSPSL